MDTDRSVTASFVAMPPLKIPGMPPSYYNTFTTALADTVAIAANSSATLYGQAVNVTGGFNLNRPVTIAFEGGFDAGFQSDSGGAMTVLVGGLKITNGSLRVKNLVLQ